MKFATKPFVLLVCLAIIFTLAACGLGDTIAPTPETTTSTISTISTTSAMPIETPKVPLSGYLGDIKSSRDLGAPDDTNTPEWCGIYTDEWYVLEIDSFDDDTLSFTFYNTSDGHVIEKGVATLTPDDNMVAEYDSAAFILENNSSVVEFVENEENGNLAHLIGHYSKVKRRGVLSTDEDKDSRNNASRDMCVPNWWGTFARIEFIINISNFDGTSFNFTITDKSYKEVLSEGVAILDSENSHLAILGQIGFYLYEDYSAVDFLADKNSGWDYLRGGYVRRAG